MTSIIDLAERRQERESQGSSAKWLAAGAHENFVFLIELLSETRSRVQGAKTFQKALEHYARGMRRYHEFRGCFSTAHRLKSPMVKAYAPAAHLDEMFVICSSIELVHIALTSIDPWRCASGLEHFRRAAVATLGSAILLATEGQRASGVVGGITGGNDAA